jgi:hypothetical protein
MTNRIAGPNEQDLDDPDDIEQRALGIDPEDFDDKLDPEEDGTSWDVTRERAKLEEALLEMDVDEAIASVETDDDDCFDDGEDLFDGEY